MNQLAIPGIQLLWVTSLRWSVRRSTRWGDLFATGGDLLDLQIRLHQAVLDGSTVFTVAAGWSQKKKTAGNCMDFRQERPTTGHTPTLLQLQGRDCRDLLWKKRVFRNFCRSSALWCWPSETQCKFGIVHQPCKPVVPLSTRSVSSRAVLPYTG